MLERQGLKMREISGRERERAFRGVVREEIAYDMRTDLNYNVEGQLRAGLATRGWKKQVRGRECVIQPPENAPYSPQNQRMRRTAPRIASSGP